MGIVGGVGRPIVAAILIGGLYCRPVRAENETPTKLDCIAADTDGQSLRLDNKLRAARKRFDVCASASCPKIVREDCVQRIDEVEKAQPTVIFSATNGKGRPVRAVRVFMDDTLLAERLDGQPLPIDPGEHLFTFTALGRIDAKLSFTIREGEKERHAVVLRTASGEPASVAPPTTQQGTPVTAPSAPLGILSSSTPEASVERTRRPAPATFGDANATTRDIALALGGAGILGLGVGSIFGIITVSNWNAAQHDCGRACSANSAGQREERSAAADGTTSTVAFVAGGAALAAGALLWFVTPESPASPTGLRIVPTVIPHRGDISLETKF